MGDGCVNERRTEGGEGERSGWRKESELCTPALGRSTLVNDQSQSKFIFGIFGLLSKSFDLLSPDKQ